MSRARNIKPGFFKNDVLAECDPLARILFAGLWCEADREGRLEDRPKRLKAEYLAYDNCDVDALLSELAQRGFIRRYEVNGGRYIQVCRFSAHQNPHHMESASDIPPPAGETNKYSHSPISPKQRARIYERDGHACVFCGSKDNLQIDHIVLLSKGGSSSDDNLRTLCAQCNNKRSKTGKPETNPADSLIPDSPSLIPDSLIQEQAVEKIQLADGSDFDVTSAFVAEMSKAYPRVDVKSELVKMRAWAISNPGKRKTARGMPRFINSWLSGAAERVASVSQIHRPAPGATDMDYLTAVAK